MKRLFAAVALILLGLATTGAAQTSLPAASAAASGQAAPARASDESELPIRRVVLYKNGVGYFEHRAEIHGNQQLSLRFTTAQLNDVLKSLTVVDRGGGRVTSVRYNSVAPLGQRLGSLPLPLDGKTTRAAFLRALRGANMEVRSRGVTATGRLLSVEKVSRPDKNGNAVERTRISLISRSGTLRSFDLTPATSVRILDSAMTREVSRYLALVASARDKNVRTMTITDQGKGRRELDVSYISEVPVWKSTYRIVLSDERGSRARSSSGESNALLQGWAVVDNTVGQDWRDVELSLVAGAPQSFIEPIAQPYYIRRPVVELPKNALLTPQTHEGGEYAPSAATPEAAGALAQGIGGGIAGEALARKSQKRLETNAARMAAPFAADEMTSAAARAKALERSFQPQATGEALGTMFAYNIGQRVTIPQNQSALVPIVQARVKAEKVTLWNAKEPVPVRALWLDNSSGLTLDGGSFEVIQDGVFAGEGLVEEIHPKERRLLSYAADTAVRVKSAETSAEQPYTRLRAARGILTLTRELRRTRTYTVTNSDTTPRTVILEHPVQAGWHLLDQNLKPAETTRSYYRFRLRLPPASTKKLAVAEYYPEQTTYALSTIDDGTIGMILQTRGIQPKVEKALRKLLAKKDAIADLQREIAQLQGQVRQIGAEQARIRENMKVLRGSAAEKALTQRYVASLNQEEDRLDKLNLEISTKQVELNRRQREYQQTAELITFDQTR